MSEPAPTRLDVRPTRLDGATRGSAAHPHTTFNLPGALAAQWRIVRALPANGAEAELLVVQRLAGDEQAVAKLYRPGIRPPTEALERLRGAVLGDVVRMLERGESDGIDYELMEYCPAGSLADHLGDVAHDVGFARRLLEWAAPALDRLHGVGLIHRDLKPGNILLRSREPLDAVLTDFGISSVADATVHFTGTSRTVRYAPPEAMTGVLSIKADHWSLGMILFEIVSGRHPFDGLSEAVINHRLMTRSVDVSAIDDPGWQNLLRGLLLRDPDTRWGGAELQRWLAGDAGLAFLALPADELRATVRPYRIGDASCSSATELVLALVGHWEIGVKDVARGFVGHWLRDEARDLNLSRRLADLMDASMSPDQRLLRFALEVVPDLPPVWKGTPLGDDSLQSCVRQALAGSPAHNGFLQDLFAADALGIFERAGHPEAARLADLRARWAARVAAFHISQERLARAETESPPPSVTVGGHADFDDLEPRPPALQARPPLPHALLLAPDHAPERVAETRLRLGALLARLADDAPWFASLGMPDVLPIDALAVLETSHPRALDFAERQRAQRARELAEQRARAHAVCSALSDVFATTRGLAAQGSAGANARGQLRSLHQEYLRLHAEAFADGPAPQAFASARHALRQTGPLLRRLHLNLNRLEHLSQVRDVLIQRGWPLVLVALVLLWAAGGARSFYLSSSVGGVALLWYFWLRAHASGQVRRCAGALPDQVEDEPAQRAAAAPGRGRAGQGAG